MRVPPLLHPDPQIHLPTLHRATLPIAVYLALSSLLAASPAPLPQDGPEAWIKEFQTRRDDAGAELIHKIAGEKSREAMQVLVAGYDNLQTVFMRREVVRALPQFSGVAGAEQPAIEKLAAVATGAQAPELREAAVTALGACGRLGRSYLERIVESRAPDELRMQAIRAHAVGRGQKAEPQADQKKSDEAFYRRIWNPERERREYNETKGVEIPELEAIRELAFTGIRPLLGDTELVETMRAEFNPKIRRAAMTELVQRDSPKADEMAEWLFNRVDIPGPERVEAARILARVKGPAIVPEFLAIAKKEAVTQEDLRRELADLIVGMDDAKVNKHVIRLLGRGKPHEKVFALQVTRHIDDERVLDRIRKGFSDKSFEVRRETARVLAARGDRAAVPELLKMLEKPRSPDDVRVAIEAIGAIEKDAKDWTARLRKLVGDPRREARNAALDQLARQPGAETLALLVAALSHEDWTTRLTAVRALEARREAGAVPALIARLGAEKGAMSRAVADTLWSLTGQPFEENAERWQAWWKDAAKDFTVLAKGDLAKAEKERETRRLMQRTGVASRFFGIRIVSHRVIFIIDTSGSMTEPVHGRMNGKRGATRIDVAKEELAKSIDSLDKDALFNVLSFSFGVGRWLKEGIAMASEHSREEALTFVDRLGAGGPTNLYDTLKIAFADPDVDTLYVLSDGEPTAGEVLDPHTIREDVRFWNKHRRIKIHTVAIGGNLEILEWLAEDSGGQHVRMR